MTKVPFNHRMPTTGRTMAALGITAIDGTCVLPMQRLMPQSLRCLVAQDSPKTNTSFGACKHEDWHLPGEAGD